MVFPRPSRCGRSGLPFPELWRRVGGDAEPGGGWSGGLQKQLLLSTFTELLQTANHYAACLLSSSGIITMLFFSSPLFGQAPVIQWQKSLGSYNGDYPQSIRQTSDGGYIVGGYTEGADGDVEGYHGNLVVGDLWVTKLSASGTLQWAKCLGGVDQEVNTENRATAGWRLYGGCVHFVQRVRAPQDMGALGRPLICSGQARRGIYNGSPCTVAAAMNSNIAEPDSRWRLYHRRLYELVRRSGDGVSSGRRVQLRLVDRKGGRGCKLLWEKTLAGAISTNALALH